MSTGKEALDLEDELVQTDANDSQDPPVEVAKINLAKRRTIDNLLDEKRLKKQLTDYDFDL